MRAALSIPKPSSLVRIGAVALALSTGLTAQFDPTAPEPIHPLGGTFFVGGGGAQPEEVAKRFLEMGGGEKARIVVLSTVVMADDAIPFGSAGAEAHAFMLVSSDQLDAAAHALSDATCAWLAGDAVDMAALSGTAVEKALQALVERGGVIGCNGSVSSALSKVMITGGNGHAELGTGLDLIPGAVIDPGFDPASDKNRLLGVVSGQPTLVGLGIDQDGTMVLHRRYSAERFDAGVRC